MKIPQPHQNFLFNPIISNYILKMPIFSLQPYIHYFTLHPETKKYPTVISL